MHTGIYVHVPFCQAKCSYCDFVSIAGRGELYEPYVEALTRELRQCPAAHMAPGHRDEVVVETIYLGGGTPSVLPLEFLDRIIRTIKTQFTVLQKAEVSIEVNPGTIEGPAFVALKGMGFNRLSIGVQSLRQGELKKLGRVHGRRESIEAITSARAAGFRRLSIDLMYGLPGQTMADWLDTLSHVLNSRPDHLSLYALSLEEGTPLLKTVERGDLPAPDDDLAATMYLEADQVLGMAGYQQYEISNWALPGAECRHNVNTWLKRPYLGFGPAAHSYYGSRRWWNVSDPEVYIQMLMAGQPSAAGEEILDLETDMAETMILGLRLVKHGVSVSAFRSRFDRSPTDVFGTVLVDLAKSGLLEIYPDRICLTAKGRLLGNHAFAQFLPA